MVRCSTAIAPTAPRQASWGPARTRIGHLNFLMTDGLVGSVHNQGRGRSLTDSGQTLGDVSHRQSWQRGAMRIGFIVLGNMGFGMAANLLKAGHQVIAYNRSPQKVDALAAQGAASAGSVAEACAAEIVISMLADDQAVESTALGDGGIVASLPPGGVHVSSSTISVAMAE